MKMQLILALLIISLSPALVSCKSYPLPPGEMEVRQSLEYNFAKEFEIKDVNIISHSFRKEGSLIFCDMYFHFELVSLKSTISKHSELNFLKPGTRIKFERSMATFFWNTDYNKWEDDLGLIQNVLSPTIIDP